MPSLTLFHHPFAAHNTSKIIFLPVLANRKIPIGWHVDFYSYSQYWISTIWGFFLLLLYYIIIQRVRYLNRVPNNYPLEKGRFLWSAVFFFFFFSLSFCSLYTRIFNKVHPRTGRQCKGHTVHNRLTTLLAMHFPSGRFRVTWSLRTPNTFLPAEENNIVIGDSLKTL